MMHRRDVISCLMIILVMAMRIEGSNCNGANPNDQIADDDALQACLNVGGTITLDPGTPGYIIAKGLNITVNGTTITSSLPPTKATIIASAALSLPIIQTTGIISYITLTYLLVDGNKNNRATKNAQLCDGTNNLNYRTTNIMLPGYVINGVWDTWNPYVYIDNGLIHDVTSVNSPCGTGIGIQGRNYEIYNCNVSSNGWDAYHNPQNLPFPYADGINAAVCYNAHIHDNIIVDNTNMQVTAGPGPYCWLNNNVIIQDKIITQCAVNCWPTNIWMTTPVWWHLAPWDLSHSAIVGNTIYSTNTVNAGALSGIAVGALPWVNYTLTNAGLVYNNNISGANIDLMVDGVTVGTIFGNKVSGATTSGGKTSSICANPQLYTVAKSSRLFLQPGYTVYSFDVGRSCFATGENIVSTIDNAKFVSWTINGALLPVTLSGARGTVWTVVAVFMNTGTSVWQDIVGGNGYKLGDWINTAAPFWGVYRAQPSGFMLYPGGELTFQFSITLPSTTGTYTFQWRMVQELVNWFGELSPAVKITVV